MTILSDKDIENEMSNDNLGIEPFNQKNLTPNGYDLSIDEVYIRKTDHHIKEGKATIPPMTCDAGFHGTLTISCFNSNDEELEIPIGDRFCQIVFEHLSSAPTELYEKKSGNYQNQRGVKLE